MAAYLIVRAVVPEADRTKFDQWYQDVHRHQAAYAERDLRRLEMYVFPHLGANPIAGIDSLRILNVLRLVERAGKDAAVFDGARHRQQERPATAPLHPVQTRNKLQPFPSR